MSDEATAPADDLPPTLASMWRLCKLGYRFEPSLMLVSFALVMLAALPGMTSSLPRADQVDKPVPSSRRPQPNPRSGNGRPRHLLTRCGMARNRL